MSGEQRSAEKDLLKLIENPAEFEAQKKEMAKVRGGFFADSSSALAGEGTTGSNKKSIGSMVATLTDRKQIIRALILVTALMAGYFIFTVFHEYSKVKSNKNLEKFNYIYEGKEINLNPTLPGSAVDSMESSEGVLPETARKTIRNIFKPWNQQADESGADAGTVVSGVKDYKLVGISMGRDPAEAYAMVENVKTELTFFLKIGEKIAGMELVEITDNKLVFKENGQSVELR